MSQSNERSGKSLGLPSGIDFLISSCVCPVAPDRALFRAKVQGIADWHPLMDSASAHGLRSLLAARILKDCPDAVTTDVRLVLSNARRDAIARDLFFHRALVGMLQVFQQEGIAALPLKGPLLAQTLYSDSSLRPSSDLDLLVHSQDLHRAVRILNSKGCTMEPFLARVPLPKLMQLKSEILFHNQQGVMIDLHWEITPSDYPFRIDPAVLWDSARPVEFDGAEVLTVAPEALLVFLCVHGTKHAWSRLIWLADVARLIQKGVRWEEAFALAIRSGCERPLLLGLLLVGEVLDADVPGTYVDRARAQRVIVLLAEQVKRRFASEFPAEPSGLELTIFNTRLAERWWDKVRHFAALCKAPTEAELARLSFPPKLFVLYYPLRVYRIMEKYSARLLSRE